jgi:hypothetical protein
MIDTAVIQPGADTGEPSIAGVSWPAVTSGEAVTPLFEKADISGEDMDEVLFRLVRPKTSRALSARSANCGSGPASRASR